jgi:hypothetical protein
METRVRFFVWVGNPHTGSFQSFTKVKAEVLPDTRTCCAVRTFPNILLSVTSACRLWAVHTSPVSYLPISHVRAYSLQALNAFSSNSLFTAEISGCLGYVYEDGCLLGFAPCSLVDTDRRFRGACCHRQQPDDSSVCTRLHGATSQKTAIFNDITFHDSHCAIFHCAMSQRNIAMSCLAISLKVPPKPGAHACFEVRPTCIPRSPLTAATGCGGAGRTLYMAGLSNTC